MLDKTRTSLPLLAPGQQLKIETPADKNSIYLSPGGVPLDPPFFKQRERRTDGIPELTNSIRYTKKN